MADGWSLRGRGKSRALVDEPGSPRLWLRGIAMRKRHRHPVGSVPVNHMSPFLSLWVQRLSFSSDKTCCGLIGIMKDTLQGLSSQGFYAGEVHVGGII